MEHIYKIRTHINSSKPLHGILKHYPNTIVFDESADPDALDDMKKHIALLLNNLTSQNPQYRHWLTYDDALGFTIYRDDKQLACVNLTVRQWQKAHYLYSHFSCSVRADSDSQTITVYSDFCAELCDGAIRCYGNHIIFGDHLVKELTALPSHPVLRIFGGVSSNVAFDRYYARFK